MEEKIIPVLLSVTGTSKQSDPDDAGIQLTTSGTLKAVSEGYLLKYRESQPDSDEYQDIELLMNDKTVTMTRSGAYATGMVFEKGRRFEGVYETPYGSLDMAVYATRVFCRLGEERGEVQLQYQLDMQGQFADVHELKIKYAKKGSVKPQ